MNVQYRWTFVYIVPMASVRTSGRQALAPIAAPPMPTDGRHIRGLATQSVILGEAVQMASVEGLDGLTMARLAERLRVPKSSVHAAFGSKQNLQVAVLRETREILVRLVVVPALSAPAGSERLVAVGESWIGYLSSETFQGGCLLAAASSELDGRPGPARDALAAIMTEWLQFLADNVRQGIAAGDLAKTTKPEQLAFELNAVGLAANWHHQLFGGATAFKTARIAWVNTLARHTAHPTDTTSAPNSGPAKPEKLRNRRL
jgi:AcrR family transcriptional regulator